MDRKFRGNLIFFLADDTTFCRLGVFINFAVTYVLIIHLINPPNIYDSNDY